MSKLKHIKRFESINFKLKGRDRYEKSLQILWDEFWGKFKNDIEESDGVDDGGFYDVPNTEYVIEFFDKVQEEFDSSENIDIYAASFRDSQAYTEYGYTKAYGENHALLKISIQKDDVAMIINDINICVEILEEEDIINRIKSKQLIIKKLEGDIKDLKSIK